MVAAMPMSEDSPEARVLRTALVRGLSLEASSDARVLDAMRAVPRHLFVPAASLAEAYADMPVPIGHGQTISQPSMVAIMTSALGLAGGERVLEIGTGSGYQAAILSLLAAHVYSVEIVPALADMGGSTLRSLGYGNARVRAGDGYAGWPEEAPFDRILLTAAPGEVPRKLFDQLSVGGTLVAPVGADTYFQRLLRYRKQGGRLLEEALGEVRFVPMVHGA
jgi:protein-L-isoaspartate(D-aspartate) O-methyltransferase